MVRKDCFKQTLTVVTSIFTKHMSREVYKYIIDKYLGGNDTKIDFAYMMTFYCILPPK